MRRKWNKTLNITIIIMTVILTGVFVWTAFRKNNVDGDTSSTLPEGIISSSVITDRLAFGVNEDGQYNYGIETDLALDTFLSSNLLAPLLDTLEELNNHTGNELLDYIGTNKDELLIVIAQYFVNENGFDSAFNMVDFLNENYNLRILKTKNINGEEEPITDAEAIFAAINAVVRWVNELQKMDEEDVLSYIGIKKGNFLSAIAEYLDVNRFASAFNMVDFLNDNYNLGISKIKNVNGKVQTITDAEAILAAINAVERWEIEKKLNTQLIIEYTNLQQAIAYVKEQKLIDYTDNAKLIQYIQLDAVGHYIANRFGISYSALTTEQTELITEHNWDVKKIYNVLMTNTTIVSGTDGKTITNIFGASGNYSVAGSKQGDYYISTIMLQRIKTFADTDTGSEVYRSRLNTALSTTTLSGVSSYIKAFIANFSNSNTNDVFAYNYIGTYINLQKIFAYLKTKLGDNISYGPDLRDAVKIITDNVEALELSTWKTSYADYWRWTNKEIGTETVYNAISDLITIINQKELDTLYESGIIASEKITAQQQFIINYAKAVDSIDTVTPAVDWISPGSPGYGLGSEYNKAKTFLKASTLAVDYVNVSDGPSGNSQIKELFLSAVDESDIIAVIRDNAITITNIPFSVSSHNITPTSVYSEIVRQWILSKYNDSETSFPRISSSTNIQNATVNDMAYYIVNKDAGVGFESAFDFNGIDCLIDQKSADNNIRFTGTGSSIQTFRANAEKALESLYSTLLVQETKDLPDINSNYNLIGIVNEYINSRFFEVSTFEKIAYYINGFDRAVPNTTKIENINDVLSFMPYIPRSSEQTIYPLTETSNVHVITSFLYTANNYAAQTTLVTRTLTHVKSYLNSKESATFLLEDTLLATISKLGNKGYINVIKTLADSNDYLINALGTKVYEYNSTYTTAYAATTINLPLTESDVMTNIINQIESTGGNNGNIISPYSSTATSFISNLKEFINSHYGFIFSAGRDENLSMEIFNLIQIAEIEKLRDLSSEEIEKLNSLSPFVYSTSSFAELVTVIWNFYKNPDNENPELNITENEATYNHYIGIIGHYNAKTQDADDNILSIKENQKDNWKALQDWLKLSTHNNINMYIPGPKWQGEVIGSQAVTTARLVSIVGYLKSEGYDIEIKDSATEALKENETIYKIITELAAMEGEGIYSPSVKESFNNDDIIMLNNAVADKKLKNSEVPQETIENLYLQFGQRYSTETLDLQNNIYITSMDVSATLNGSAIKVSSPMIQYSENGMYGFHYAGNIYYNYYWYQYLDLKNIRTFGITTIDGVLISDASGYYEFTFSYTYTIANGDTIGSNGTSYGTQQYTISFYLSDEGIYYDSYPTFDTNTVEKVSPLNSATQVYNYNQTEDSSTLKIDPSLYRLLATQIDTGLATHTFTTDFVEGRDGLAFTGSFRIYRNGVLQTINCAQTTIYYYQKITESDESLTNESLTNAGMLYKQITAEGVTTYYYSKITMSQTPLTGEALTAAGTLFATVEYGTTAANLVNQNNGDGGFRDASGAEGSTYLIKLYNEEFFPGTGQKGFEHNSYFPEIAVQFTENGEYNLQVQYLLRFRNSSSLGFTYQGMENSENLFAMNFRKYYDEKGATIDGVGTPSYLTDPYYNLYNFGVNAYFNKLDAGNKKLELRDYKTDIRSDYSYLLNNTTYMNEGSFTSNGLAEIKALLVKNAAHTLKTLRIGGVTPILSSYTNTINDCINITELYNYLYGIQMYPITDLNEFTIGSTTYTIDGTNVTAGTDTYPITNNQFEINSLKYIINILDDTNSTVSLYITADQTLLFAYVLDKANLLPNTNMPTISFNYLGRYVFNGSLPVSTYTRYSSITSSLTRAFTKDTLISDLGLYIVNVVYSYTRYDGGSSNLTQSFIFRISTGEPSVTIHTTSGTTQNIATDDTITANEYTNKKVYLSWDKATFFQYEYWAEVATTGTSTYTWTANPTFTNYSAVTQDDRMVGALLTANGGYRVAVYYGNSASSGNASKTVKGFIIDTTPISNLKTYIVSTAKEAGKYFVAGESNNPYLDSSFTISYDTKASGARITANYKKIPLSSFSSPAEILGVLTGGAISDASYVTTNYGLDVAKIATTPVTADFLYEGGAYSLFDSINDRVILGKNDSALYIFSIIDQAGNPASYFVLYDLTKPYVNVYEEPTNAYNIISTDTTLFWGAYKAIYLDYSIYDALTEDQKAIIDLFMSSTFFTADQVTSNVRTLENTPMLNHAIPSTLSGYDGSGVTQDAALSGKYIVIPNAKANVIATATESQATTIDNTYTNLMNTKSVKLLAEQITEEADYAAFKGEQTYIFTVTSGSHIDSVKVNDVYVYEGKKLDYSNNLQMSFDNSIAIAFGSAADSDTTGNINSLGNLDQLGQGIVYNAGQLIFSFLPGETENYEVDTVEYYYYEIDTLEALLNDYTSATFVRDNLKPLYPFVYNTNSPISLYSRVSPSTNKNSISSTDLDRWFSNCINPEMVDGNRVSKSGMYVFKRTYVPGSIPVGSLDSEVYYYVFYVDRGEIISIDYLNAGEYPFDYANGYDISIVLGTNPTTKAVFTAGDIDTLVREGMSLFETNKLPVALNVPVDKYNSHNIIDVLNASQPAGYEDAIARLQAIKAEIVSRNNRLFGLSYLVSRNSATLGDTSTTDNGISTSLFSTEGLYSITLSTGSIPAPTSSDNDISIGNISYGNGALKFEIVTEFPNGKFYGQDKDGSTTSFNKKVSSETAFENTNTNVLYFSFADRSQPYIADVDYKNFIVYRDGSAIYSLTNGVTAGNKAAYTFAPIDSNEDVLSALYTVVGEETRFYYTDTDYYVVNADGYINMFDNNGILREIPRKQIKYNGATVLFSYRICIFDDNSPSIAALSNSTVSSGKIETKFEVRVQFEGNEDDYGDYFYQTYSIIVDRIKPQSNLNNLVLNEINAVVSALYTGYTVSYEGGNYVIRNQSSEIMTNSDISALIAEITTTLSNSENLDYSFYLNPTFNMYSTNENKESSHVYYKYLGYDLANHTPTTTPDDTDDYTFSLTSGDWSSALTYPSSNQFNLYTSITGSDGYYEIVEVDQAGNYRVYVVYKGSTIPTYTYRHWNYPVLESGTSTETSGQLTGSVYNKSVNGEDLDISSISASDYWQYAKVTIKTFTTAGTTLENAPTSIALFSFTPSLTSTNIDLDQLAAQINSYIDSIISETAEDGYLVTVQFYNRSTNRVYTLTYQKAGNRLQINTNTISSTQFQVIFGNDTTNTVAQNIQIYLYSQSAWEAKTKDDSTSNNPISVAIRTYTFSQGLYKFVITDNYGRQTTLIHQINITDVLTVQPSTTGTAFARNSDNYYSNQNMVLTYQSKLRNASVSAVGYTADNVSFGATTNGAQELILGSGSSITGTTLTNLYRTTYYSDSGLREILLYNWNTASGGGTALTTQYSVLVFNITLQYANLATENIRNIRVVYINTLPTITVTDSDGNIINGTKFLEEVTLSWPDINIENTVIPVSASIIRTYFDEDSNISKTETYSAEDSFTMTLSGSYRVILASSFGYTSSRSYSFIGGSISMYDVNTVNGTISTPLNASPQAGYITINGTQVEPVRTYFAQMDYFVPNSDTSLKAKYLSVVANADENLTVTELRSYKSGVENYTSDTVASVVIPDANASALTYKIYKIHGDNTSTVFAEYLVIYFIQGNSDFAGVAINNSSDSETLQIGNKFDDNSLTLTWHAFNGMRKNTVYCDVWYNNEMIGTYYSATTNEATLTLHNAGHYKIVFRDLANNEQSFASSTLSYPYLTFYLVNDVIFNVNNSDPIPNFITNNNVYIQILNQELYTQPVTLTYLLNGVSKGTATAEAGGYVFRDAGYYQVTMTTVVTPTIGDPRTITTTYNFIIIDPNTALLCYNLPAAYGFTITNFMRGNENITYELDTLNSLWLSSADFGVGKYTIALSYTNPSTGQVSAFSFLIWINDEIPSLVCSIPWGTGTTKTIYIYFNPKLIYDMIGNSIIDVSGQGVYTIDETSINEKITLELTQNTTYTVKIASLDGRTICLYKVTKNEPLNTTAIIIIVVACALVVGLTTLFIIIRTRVKFR